MWSPFYWYYEIRHDAAYSGKLPTNVVLEILENIPVLQKKDNQVFCNQEGFPWVDIVAVNSDNGNYGRPENFNSEWVNLITVVGSKSAPENEALYITLLTEIAEKINWEFISEEGDDNNEYIVLRTIKPDNSQE